MKLGAQMFGCAREFRRDTNAFFDGLVASGYGYVEPVILLDGEGPLVNHFGGLMWSIDEAPGFIVEMAKRGLRILSAHMFGVDVTARLDEMKRLADYGVKAFVFGLPRDLSALTVYAEKLEGIARELEKVGCEAWLHNSQGAFAGAEGESAFEIALKTAPSLKSQIDTGWAMFDGRDAYALIKKPEIRLASLHLKDMARDFDKKSGAEIFAVLGEGVTDIPFALECAGDVPIFIDQDVTDSTFARDLRVSALAVRSAANRERPNARDEISVLEIFDIETGERTALREFDCVIEAPNWSKDGKYLLYNSKGHMFRYMLDTGDIIEIDTGCADHCNNDHVISPDGTQLAVSHMALTEAGFSSKVYILPIDGGEAREITPNSPSFLHGWSPDGETLAYCAFRDRENGGDIYTISVNGGEETQITSAKGLNDGPEYDPTGEYIWFNSVRTGLMQAWRMKKDGTEQTQMTFDAEMNTWFPHISPDGKKVVMIAYYKGDLEPGQHLAGRSVQLRLMNADGGNIRTIASFYGGQGTINVNSWAPDSRRFAFVSYRPK